MAIRKKTMGKRGFEAVKAIDFPRHFQKQTVACCPCPLSNMATEHSPLILYAIPGKFDYQRVKHSPLVFQPRPELPHSTTKAAPDTENSCCADKATYLYLTSCVSTVRTYIDTLCSRYFKICSRYMVNLKYLPKKLIFSWLGHFTSFYRFTIDSKGF